MLWRLAIVGIPFTILLIIPGFIYGKTLMGLARKMREEYNKAGSIAEQAISSIRTVYSYVGENETINAFSNALEGSMSLGLKQGLAKGLAIGSNNGIVFGIWSFMCYYGSRLVMYHGAKGGTVFSAGAAITVGGLALGSGLSNMKYLSEASSAAERIRQVIDRVPEIDSDTDGKVLGSVRGQVEFQNVDFAYPSRPETIILNGFCLKIPAGKTVALVGESGSGKSTIIALLQRFYDPLGGQIKFDGVAINKLQLKWFRSQMGLVSQEPALFATSIKENILFGKEDATEAEVIEAAKASNAHNFISMLPQGYETQVGERGTQMSGGQKQRIAIARAIIKKPRMLLLDEATSALDSHSEQIVQRALDQVSIGCTTVVVAHRLSTIRNANIIVAMRAGKVVEMGTHDELLLNHDGLYSSMVRLQQTEKSETIESDASAVDAPSSSISASNDVADVDDHSCFTHTDDENENIVKVKDEEEENKKAPPSFWRLAALNLPEWKEAVIGCLNAMVFGGVQPMYTLVMGSMMFVYFDTDHEEIKKKARVYSLCFLGLFLLSLIVNIGQHYSFAYMGECLTKRIRETMFAKILTFEIAWFDRHQNSTAAVCSRLAKDANVVRSLVGDRIGLVVQTVSAVVTAFTLGLVIAWRLAIVMICVQPLMVACFYTKRVLIKTMSKKVAKAQEESSKLAAEAVSNLRTITAFSSQNRILKMLENAQEGPRRENLRQSFYAGIGLACSQTITTCAMILNYWYGGQLVAHGYITTKALFQSFMVIVSTARVIAEAGSMTSDLAKGADAVRSIFAILDRTTKILADDGENGHIPKNITGKIEFQDVYFSYPTRPNVTIFKSFSMKIESGKSTALIGQSGSGKSTIIALIARFYDPLKGYVTIDNINVKSYNLKELRRHIAIVSQEPTLFNGTIRENIAYGSNGVDESEIIEASKLAMAHDFVTGLKNGYDTWCGEKGLQLSGGQKQRIVIARAILKNARVLLLDEATSALDMKSEKVVQEALERAMVERTSVIVAHRLCTIKKCDVIAVLEKGKVVESGTHSSLMAKGAGGAYFNFVTLQTTTGTTVSN
ncbi:ABC transporter B member 15 [Stylosanthes scabra]|uniref:ABC transporter B member 15 n=1 Tax=Stylosanthes scabra TaxID=79078 RepID=A0ABU6VMV3_9FABA|nr:ABC transporter B member 15 [Stylosanthes scabra]